MGSQFQVPSGDYRTDGARPLIGPGCAAPEWDAASGLPPRYRTFRESFDEAVRQRLVPGMWILDVGGGRSPTVPPDARPPDCRYVGLDLSAEELRAAPPGSYDDLWCTDISVPRREFEGRFDLAVSWQVLEHFSDLPAALDGIRGYLRPGGAFIAELSGRFSVFALLNQVLPRRAGVWAMERLLNRPPDTVFPAHYHRCWFTALRELGEAWSEFRVTPQYVGAVYFNFSAALRAFYLSLEDRLAKACHPNLATHYLIEASR